jgi:hypothetical protein
MSSNLRAQALATIEEPIEVAAVVESGRLTSC